MAGPYRSSTATEGRLRALEQRIAELESRLHPVFWERVAPLWKLERRARLAADTHEEQLALREARIETLLDALGRAEREAGASPDLPPLRGLETPASFGEVRRAMQLHQVDLARARQVQLKQDSALGSQTLRFRLDGAPIQIRQHLKPTSGIAQQISVQTTVAPAANLTLSEEGTLEDLLKLIGLSRDIETNDPRFDPDFLVRGDVATARAFLSGEVRFDLHRACATATPTIHVDKGIGEIRGHHQDVIRFLRVLGVWHKLPSPVPLLVEDDSAES